MGAVFWGAFGAPLGDAGLPGAGLGGLGLGCGLGFGDWPGLPG